ncbi:MAG TPA: 30S ribosomal protein S17 [Candidatus Paceibacterota bacterium]|jgi:small subunit ribosomal protein S17|nr:30S ribosomal protein S17 [Candidatus Paceibacterota bacterium]
METQRKEFKGVVVSDKMTESAVVAVSRFVKHAKYKKYIKKTSKFTVHNAGNKAKEGDKVTIRACRPMSKTKHFEIVATL